MPNRDRPHNNNDELDDDDEDGSKAEEGDYDDVRGFDEARDLPLNTKPSPNRPPTKVVAPAIVVNVPARSNAPGASKKKGLISPEQLDSQPVLMEVKRITEFPWPAAAGKRPPRDMKRLAEDDWYVVCKVMKWGDTPALFLRAFSNPEDDYGFYKPPAIFFEYHFQVGDRIQLSQTGYSASRNKIATGILVRPTHMSQVPAEKQNWVPPPVIDNMIGLSATGGMVNGGDAKGSRTKKERVDLPATHIVDSASSGPKRKKAKEELPPSMQHLEYSALHTLAQSSSPLGLKKTLGKETLPPISFFGAPQQHAFSLTGSSSALFHLGTPDLNHMNRAPSLTGFNFSANDLLMMPPPSPNLLGSASPLMGGGPQLHRIHSAGIFPSFIGSPTTNFAPPYAFPSGTNMTFQQSNEPPQSSGN